MLNAGSTITLNKHLRCTCHRLMTLFMCFTCNINSVLMNWCFTLCSCRLCLVICPPSLIPSMQYQLGSWKTLCYSMVARLRWSLGHVSTQHLASIDSTDGVNVTGALCSSVTHTARCHTRFNAVVRQTCQQLCSRLHFPYTSITAHLSTVDPRSCQNSGCVHPWKSTRLLQQPALWHCWAHSSPGSQTSLHLHHEHGKLQISYLSIMLNIFINLLFVPVHRL